MEEAIDTKLFKLPSPKKVFDRVVRALMDVLIVDKKCRPSIMETLTGKADHRISKKD